MAGVPSAAIKNHSFTDTVFPSSRQNSLTHSHTVPEACYTPPYPAGIRVIPVTYCTGIRVPLHWLNYVGVQYIAATSAVVGGVGGI